LVEFEVLPQLAPPLGSKQRTASKVCNPCRPNHD
jgi:hypothetical protein